MCGILLSMCGLRVGRQREHKSIDCGNKSEGKQGKQKRSNLNHSSLFCRTTRDQRFNSCHTVLLSFQAAKVSTNTNRLFSICMKSP